MFDYWTWCFGIDSGGGRLSVGWFCVAEAVKITMEWADKAVGFLLSYISLSIFTYYTFWVIILPFVNSDHFIHRYFLPQEYAILIPVFAAMVLLCFLSIFIGYVMLKSKKKKA
ncbi:dolichol-phosphate mannose synthase subunit 2 isoform X1 [Argentina anserina]|uniref:dolichol-phosphate mannose synthase subunit 2 isoform X1 n=2 Tax=Argentina anserina TaxID=57926 RepID=UPI00217669DD|nr:dolichol-phosphate mannose synthase subunit 2 isoform X1 [Potentilla anserina]